MSERILIVSDTHGRLNYFKEMLARTGKPDRLIHLGDSERQQAVTARLIHILKKLSQCFQISLIML